MFNYNINQIPFGFEIYILLLIIAAPGFLIALYHISGIIRWYKFIRTFRMSANFFHTHKKNNTESATRSQLVNTYRSLNHWNGFQFKLFWEGIVVGIFSGLDAELRADDRFSVSDVGLGQTDLCHVILHFHLLDFTGILDLKGYGFRRRIAVRRFGLDQLVQETGS